MSERVVEQLSLAQARRVALAAQGFTGPRRGPVTARKLLSVVERLGALQIDSVNVLCRAHYMPLFSRVGGYDRGVLDAVTSVVPLRLVEYWAHEASFVTPSTHRLLRWRMARWSEDASRRVSWAMGHPQAVELVRAVVAERGPITGAQIEASLPPVARATGRSWWNGWSPARKAIELLFRAGVITSAGRTLQFERRYALPADVLPPAVMDMPDASENEAFTELVGLAARACGVATERDLRDYFRLSARDTRTGIQALVERGDLLPVRVEGLGRPAWLHRDARLPRRTSACALLSPFDPLIWQRQRTEELFGFRYRIEIYVPAARRIHGYYVLPFLLGSSLVARVDLKADRTRGALLVRGAFEEPGAPPQTVERLADELGSMARWLGLEEVVVTGDGSFAERLRRAV